MFQNEKQNCQSMILSKRIAALTYLGKFLDIATTELDVKKQQAEIENPWFTKDFMDQALAGVRTWLSNEVLENWTSGYFISESKPQRTGLILAGNIPLVGFHDILVNFIAGNVSVIRFSEKDNILIPYLIDELIIAFPEASEYFDFDENFKTIDCLIATGNNNTANIFRTYFSNIPSLIRCHRNAVAVLHGDESDNELLELGKDVFTYFGLGCRNVSKLFVPAGYNFDHLLGLWHDHYKELVLHTKYKNNFDYKYAIYLLNQDPFLANGSIILKESPDLSSAIACLHYEFYSQLDEVIIKLKASSDQLQVIVSAKELPGLATVLPGLAQLPAIDDYADGVDTLDFLLKHTK